MKKSAVKLVQRMLNRQGFNAGTEDGIAGEQTLAAIDASGKIPPAWSKSRKLIGILQWLAQEMDVDSGKIDGYWGPQTEYAFDLLKQLEESGEKDDNWRPEDRLTINPNGWPGQKNEQLIRDFYGDVDTQQTLIKLPYRHRLAWKRSTLIRHYSCHQKVHDSLLRVLNAVLAHYGEPRIKQLGLDLFGGCLNVRKMRGGQRFSMHSWGIAVDYDPAHNQYKWGRDKARFAHSDYDAWWKCWEAEGWVSLGRQRNFDWMHIQAATL